MTTRDKLIEAGCEYLKQEDREGITRSGWWQDDVWLSDDDKLAWEFLNG